ncbi:hypothetical protein [Leeuwenhoekiella marinoflava]|uniref:Uncharacterized protein n=2 Tax=Leeuwenhoekiella marinoflava TaxID=988 RepID=A0A4Q0P6R2_9FLAO|nr:hypothetical protein [Leeuwenhoekiella marinoflava]RXG22354.1 hypothetical protein DSL99_3920 [Leeuwenhoekiella marinoflava]SHF32847.1 hypothetical protein SAMN02745246_02209 [Leeuwenhoekiella marinoflava DSM 3653]
MNYFRFMLLSVICSCSCLCFEVAAQEVYFPEYGAEWNIETITSIHIPVLLP